MSPPLKNPPVYFTVVQVRFNALLKLSDYLPSIQESLRKADYPAYSAHHSIALQITIKDGQPVPIPVPHEQYLFASVAQEHCFVLNSDSLTFQSTNYGTYELFSEAFLKGLALVHELVNLDFTERVGLRYLDHVAPHAEDNLEKYVFPEVLGLNSKLGGTPIHSFAETLNSVGDVWLRARVVTQEGGLAFPPDLLPQGMAVQSRFLEFRGKHAVLDTDGYIEGRKVFSLNTIREQLQGIHQVIGDAFKATVTPYAIDVWNRQ